MASQSTTCIEKPLETLGDTAADRFNQINASNALEGYAPSTKLLAIQKEVIDGSISIQDAIKGLRAKHGLEAQTVESSAASGKGLRR